MSINRTVVHTWIAETPSGVVSVQAKTKSGAREKIQKGYRTKVVKDIRREGA